MNGGSFETICCYLCGSGEYEGVHKLKQERTGGLEWQLVKCRNCGVVFHNPRLKEELAVDARNDRNLFADIIHAKVGLDGYANTYLNETRIRRFERELDKIESFKKSPGRILDVGSGPGTFIMVAKKRGWDGIGIDIEGWCKDAGKRLGVEIIIGDINEGILPSGSFDVSFSFSSLEHFYNPLKILKEIYRSLKPGGISVTSGLVNYDSIERKAGFRSFWIDNRPPWVLSYWTPKTIRLMHEKAGFYRGNIEIECGWIKNRIIRASSYSVKPLANFVLNKYGLGHALRVIAIK